MAVRRLRPWLGAVVVGEARLDVELEAHVVALRLLAKEEFLDHGIDFGLVDVASVMAFDVEGAVFDGCADENEVS